MLKVSKVQALQRTGRAGRERAGSCWRLLTEHEFSQLEEEMVPEILRCNFASVCLTMLSIGVTQDVRNFNFMSPPEEKDIEAAMRQLRLLGALQPGSGEGERLSPRGVKMSGLPPHLTQAILCAGRRCSPTWLCSQGSLSLPPPRARRGKRR